MKLIDFNAGHRRTVLRIEPKFYRCSVYRHPFLSIRFGCFWLTHDWNKI